MQQNAFLPEKIKNLSDGVAKFESGLIHTCRFVYLFHFLKSRRVLIDICRFRFSVLIKAI